MTVPSERSSALHGIPGVRHAFFGRRGGISTGDFASLNVSDAGGDRADHVAQNRAITADTVGFAANALATARQVHSATVLTIAEPPDDDSRPEADAMVTNVPGLALGILTADCAPVLLADAEAGVVGAFHAGWKGAIGGISEGTVAAMLALGADPARIVAAIGPTISGDNYEVGPEFAANVLERHRDAGNRITMGPNGREHFDLPGFVFDRLHEAGVGRVDDLRLCTYADPKRYFSHRYATHQKTRAGRQIAIIGLA